MSFMERVMVFFGLHDEEGQAGGYTDSDAEETHPRQRKNVVSLHAAQKQVRVMLAEPRSYDEVQNIADYLKNNRTTVVSLQRLPQDEATKVIDFLSGTVYALNGNISKLSPVTIICSPANVDIQGSISELISDEVNDLLR
ncbi:MAG: cell division protein SepF [Firmicutes bacterium]|uniref:Cell division protein SepF n=2 Tax=Melghirimyces thermohalophilus TaxID=1236220 RepID=A0A1G6HRP6_9BACL|nr:cell division protein SepF [Melghirimyces thermohalophilus]MDA8354430.1 cell division protein SepF [Bacillota bacterium]SDB96902.1 cell division inhibitor SepF [Melghirimyces thermohalophilus]